MRFVSRASLVCTLLYLLICGFNAKATEGDTEIICSNGFKSYQSSICGSGTATITMLGSNSTFKLWANPAPPQIGTETPLDTEEASSGSGSANLTTPSISTETTFYVSRVHDSGCESSRMAVTISVSETPSPNGIASGTGNYCSNETANVTITQTQSGVTYKLYRGTTYIRSVSGGGDISIPVTEADGNGTYIVKAQRGSCSSITTMYGNAVINFYDAPEQKEVTVANEGVFCSPSDIRITLDNGISGIKYELIDQNNVSYGIKNGGGYDLHWDVDVSRTFRVKAWRNDGYCSSVVYMDDQVTTSVVYPPNPQAVTGGGDFCWSETGTIELDNPQDGVKYRIFYSNGDPVPGHTTDKFNSNGSTLVWSFPFTDANGDGESDNQGTYIIKGTRAGCATVTMANSKTISYSRKPDVFTFSGGGQFCNEGSNPGATITLSDSETGIYYHLYGPTGYINSKPGTDGQSVSWNGTDVDQVGAYSVKAGETATPGSCLRNMTASGFSNVSKVEAPLNRDLTGGGTLCYGQSTTITVSSPQSGVYYKLFNNDGSEVTGHTAEKQGSNATWSFTFLDTNQDGYSESNGHYKVKARRSGCSDWVTMNDDNGVTVYFEQQPLARTFSGGGEFCDVNSSSASVVSIDNPQANIYYHLYIKHANNSLDYVSSKRTTTGYEAVEWSVRTNGNYTVKAGIHPNPDTGCLRTLSANSFSDVVTVYQPLNRALSGGGTFCYGETASLSVTNPQSGVYYKLINEDGTDVTGHTVEKSGSSVSWSFTFLDANNDGYSESNGHYKVKARRPGCSGWVTMNDDNAVTVYFEQQPIERTYSGGGEFCDTGSTAGAIVQVDNPQANIYYHLYKKHADNSLDYISSKRTTTGYESVEWSVRTNGNYTVKAGIHPDPTTGCLRPMVAGSFTNVSNVYPPAQRDVDGSGEYCWNATAQVELKLSQSGVSYELLKRNGGSYTTISSQNGDGGSLYWDVDFVDSDNDGESETNGYYVVQATGDGCPMVQMVEEANITFSRKPKVFAFDGGGQYCDTGAQSGAEIRLLNSESGIWYHLYAPSGTMVESKAGNGGELRWNNASVREEGNYIIRAGETQAPDNSCLIAMTRSTDFVAVEQTSRPLRKAVTVTNDGDICWNETARVSVTSPETDVTYYIYKDGASIPGQFNRPGYQGNVNWDITFPDGNGEYTVRGVREGCAEREMLNAVTITFTDAPDQFQVTGGGLFCEDGTTQISLSGSEDGMLYRVLRNGAEYTTWTGTGFPNDWTVSAEGDYSIVASVSGCDDVLMTDNISEYVREVVLEEPEVITYDGCSGSEFEFEVQNFNALNSGDIQTFHWYDRADDETPIHYGAKFETHVTGSGWGSFYVAAVSHTGCEGPRATVWVNLRPKPKDPVALNQYRCGPGKVTLGVGGNHYNYEYIWYNVSTSEELGRGRTFETPVLTNSRSYKVVAYHNGCESDPTFVSAIVNIVDAPAQPVVETECARQYLKVDDSSKEEGIEWYWQGLNGDGKDRSVKADRDFLVSAPGTYYIRAYDPEKYCWSESIPTEVLAHEVPRIVPDGCNRISVNLGDLGDTSPEYPASDRYNYVKTYSPRQANVTVDDIEDQENPLGDESLGLVTAYFDGLGRALQTVSRRASSTGTDFVQPYEYDEFGRSVRDYSPYASDQVSGDFILNPFQEQQSKLRAHFVEDDIFFGLTSYENSPLERVRGNMAPGNAWVGSGVGTKINYLTNTLSDDVKIWTISEAGVPEAGMAFGGGELHVVSTDDEEGITTKEYRDKSGKLLLKKSEASSAVAESYDGWLSTYYIYDTKDQLLFIVPPNAVEVLSDFNWVWDIDKMKPLVYEYGYDGLGRQITKQIPGGSRIDMVYDKHDRLVAIQDGNQRDGEPDEINWTFNKFDSHNRPVMTGLFYSTKDRAALQEEIEAGLFSSNVTEAIPQSPGITEAVDLKVSEHRTTTDVYRARTRIVLLPGFNSGTSQFETEIDDQLSIDNHEGYNDGAFPASSHQLEIHEVIYYDDYRFTNKTFDTNYPAFETMVNGIDPQPIANASGLRTGSRVRVLGTDQWMENVYYYDNQQRLVQQRIDNRNGGEKIETRQYDFVGKKLQTHTKVTNPEAEDLTEISIRKKFHYDDEGRLTSVEQDLNNSGNFKTIGSYAYDPMGKIGQRVLGDNLETLDYTYNVRGWLRGINGQELKNDGIMEDRFFAMSLSYGHGFNKVQTDGMVSGQIWKSKTDPTIRAFGYDYDPLNRLVKADYSQKEADGSWDVNFADYSVDNMVYDAAGNITSLRRQGMVGGMKEEIDALSYTYSPTMLNQLVKVEDNSINDEGFKNINTDEDDFVYDANGNVITDANKDIAYVKYNYLNLPEKVTMFTDEGVNKNVTYIYDGLGKKLSEVTNDNGEITTIDYIDGFTYENGALKTFPHDEGRVRNTGKSLVYDYYVKDHLGNNRMTLTEDRKETEYLATMETDDDPDTGVNLAEYEEQLFTNVAPARVTYGNANYTVNLSFEADKVARLNGNSPANRVGPGKMLAVSTGDIINMEAFAYYEGEAQVGDAISPLQMVGAVAGAFGGLNGGNQEQQYIFDQFNTASAGILAGPDVTDNGQPRAYLNYLLFDENFNYVDAGFVQVGEEAYNELGNPAGEIKHQQLEMQRSITSNGYIFIYVSNESDADFNVYFDDLRIKHTQGSILSEDQYYPYGMKISGLSFNAPKVEGIAAGDKFGIGWNDLGFRSYDPKIARFYATDPLSENSTHLSTYHYAKDNPVSNFDAFGLQATGTGNEDEDEWIKRLMEQYRVDFSVEEVDPATNGGNAFNVVVTVVGQRVPREFRELNWKERIIEMQVDIVKREKAAEKEADKLAQRDQDRNNRKTTEGLPFTAGVTQPPGSSSTEAGPDSENKNENTHLTKTQRAAQKDGGAGKSQHEQFNLDNTHATQLPTIVRRGQAAMNSNSNGDGNFNNESKNDGSVDRRPATAEIVFEAGENGSKVTTKDQNGEDLDTNVPNSNTGSFGSRPSFNGKSFRIKWSIRPPFGALRVTIVPDEDDWTDEEKQELEETVAAAVAADMKKEVSDERSNLADPDKRQGAIERLNVKFLANAKKHANRMKDKKGSFGLKFYADEVGKKNLTDEEKEKVEDISEELDKLQENGLIQFYNHRSFYDSNSDYSIYYNLGYWGFDYDQYLQFLRDANAVFEAQKDAIEQIDESKTMVLFIRRIPMLKLTALPLDKKMKVLTIISEDDGHLTSNPGTSDSNGDGDIDEDDNTPIRDLSRIEELFPDEKETARRVTESMSDDEFDDFMGKTRDPKYVGLYKNLWDGFSRWGGPNALADWTKSQVDKATRNFNKDRSGTGSEDLTFDEKKDFHEDLQDEGKSFVWDGNSNVEYITEIKPNGKLSLTVTKPIFGPVPCGGAVGAGSCTGRVGTETVYGPEELDPEEPVQIISKLNDGKIGLTRGLKDIVPAMTLHYLNKRDANNEINNNIMIGVNVVGIAVGLPALSGGIRTVGGVIALLDIVFSTTDIIIISNEDAIRSEYGEEGDNFIDAFNIVSGIFTLTDLATNASKLADLNVEDIQNVTRFWTKNGSNPGMADNVKSVKTGDPSTPDTPGTPGERSMEEIVDQLKSTTKQNVASEFEDPDIKNFVENTSNDTDAFIEPDYSGGDRVASITQINPDGSVDNLADLTKGSDGTEEIVITSSKVNSALEGMSETNKAELIADLKSNPGLLSAMHKKPELKDSWNALGGAGSGSGLRTNLDHLNKVDSYLRKFPNRTPDDFKNTSNLFENTEDYLDVLGDITDGNLVHGVNFDKFKSTSGTGGNTDFDEYSFSLFKKKEWGKLEEFYSNNSLNDGWPPSNGGFNVQSEVALNAGARFDRFGNDFGTTASGNPNLGGSYTSPLNDGPFSFDQRALIGNQGDYQYYYEIEVLQDLDFTSELSDVIPWHGKAGGGEQSLWNLPQNPATGNSFTFTELAEAGLIKITIKDEPGGQVLQVIDNN